MAWVRKSTGKRVQVPKEEIWGKEKTVAELEAEREARLQSDLDRIVSKGSDRDKALAMLIADIWRSANPGMTQNEARQAVRDRLETHLRNIRSLEP